MGALETYKGYKTQDSLNSEWKFFQKHLAPNDQHYSALNEQQLIIRLPEVVIANLFLLWPTLAGKVKLDITYATLYSILYLNTQLAIPQ